MTSRTTKQFRAQFRNLPDAVREQARMAFRQFLADPRNPGLHFRQVHPTLPIFSARVGLHYRAVCSRDGNTLTWFWIGSHADYDKLLGGL
jgi:hypothetical protein